VNPYLLIVSCLGQVAILEWISPWGIGLAGSLGACVVFCLFAFTRLRWGAHLDMYLAMLGWGGLGMLLPTLVSGSTCHQHFDWAHFGSMSIGMWVFALVPIWREARCLEAARATGSDWNLLLLDALGMQIGMGLAHLPLLWLPMGDVRVEWLAHALMLSGMGLGMMSAQWLNGEWERQDIAAMG